MPLLVPRVNLRLYVLRVFLPSPRLAVALGLFIVAIVGGTVGYLALTDLGPRDAFHQTVITLSTVGYGELEPFDGATRVFTSCLIVLGVGTAIYAFSAMLQEALETDLHSRLYSGRERMRIEQLSGHAIVCGYGRVGRKIANELRRQDAALVVVEEREDRVRVAREEGAPCRGRRCHRRRDARTGGGQGLVFAELEVDGISGAVGASCGDLLAGTSATLLGVRHDGEVVVGPPAEHRLQPGDILMLFGDEHAIAAFGSRS